MTYLVLNLVFLAVAAVPVFFMAQKTKRALRGWLVATPALLILTVIGDNFIVSSGIVEYDPSKILGVKIGSVPVEDFCYALVAITALPVLWGFFGRKSK